MKKCLILTLFSILLVSCNYFNSNKNGGNFTQTSIPKEVDSDFKLFLKYFNQDSVFQVSRVVFPFRERSADPDQQFDLIEKKISRAEYQKMDFTYDESSANKQYDSYRQHIRIKGNKAVIEYRGVENGIFIDCYFEKRNGKWMFVEMVDSST
ncbi:hypothetical protein C3K47_05100 [Solitalea longa]|uniref:DUF4348 domain-containing protein n=1 Tax=Solitalea longa TaxID=2079460 RepID=A0A2S5A5V7_9SPHI|nr:DUF4348 domain-containing protein [Solitalea longa]POY37906.1 hypothetical protein C3K47_05100 [Solitalea longa]